MNHASILELIPSIIGMKTIKITQIREFAIVVKIVMEKEKVVEMEDVKRSPFQFFKVVMLLLRELELLSKSMILIHLLIPYLEIIFMKLKEIRVHF